MNQGTGPLLETTCLSYGCFNSWEENIEIGSWTIPQKKYRLLGIVMANKAWKWKTMIYGWPKLAKSPKRGLDIFHLDLIRKSETCIDIWIIEQLSWCLPFCTWELATNGWRHFAFTNHPKKSVYSPSICSSTMLVGETLTFEVYPWNLNGFFPVNLLLEHFYTVYLIVKLVAETLSFKLFYPHLSL
jgi:hypothetical protein